MKTKGKVPEWVDNMKVFEWEQETPLHEGIISIQQMCDEASKYCNWLMFYSYCYARTQGFTNKCMKNWDYANFGGVFKTSRDGIKDALSEFVKFEDTQEIAEQTEIEKIYNDVEAFCRGVVWTEPDPLPPLPEPQKPPTPPPVEPKPEEPKPQDPPSDPGTPFDWKKWVKIILPILGVAATIGGFFMPGWAKTILQMLIEVLKGLGA